MTSDKKIKKINEIVKKLPSEKKEIFNRFYEVELSTSYMKIPNQMKPWIKTKFGSVKNVKKQYIIHIKNRFTGEGTLFNELRSSRPFDCIYEKPACLDDKKNCLFCEALKKTPEDTFGRIKGKFCITASNVAKYDYFHGLVIFKEHNPLKLKKEWLKDYLKVSEKWFEKTEKKDPKAIYKFLMWNCLWKSGASIIHGHMQLTASKTEYGKIKHLKDIVQSYNEVFGKDYFEDLYEIHNVLGLAKKIRKTKILFYLTPIKEKEILIISEEKSFANLSDLIYKILEKYKKIGVQTFNFSIFKINNLWFARLVDRGSLNNNSSDIGSMELFADSVVASDPFRLAEVF